MEKYCRIDSVSEEGFADLTFEIIRFEKKLFQDIYVECVAEDGDDTVGFALKLKSGMTGFFGNDPQTWHCYKDGIRLLYLEGLSDRFINSISRQYGLGETDAKLNKCTVIECGALTANPLDYKKKTVEFKCFLDAQGVQYLYAEFYLNIDLVNRRVYLREKDPHYRKNIVTYLSVQD